MPRLPLFATPLPRPDFLRPVARPGPLAWAWLATAALVLAAAGWDAWLAWQGQQAAQARLSLAMAAQARSAGADRADPAQRPSDRPAASSAALQPARTAAQPYRADAPIMARIGAPSGALADALPGAPIDAPAMAEARQWLQRLGHPWPAVWAAAEGAATAAPGLAWLGLVHGQGAALRLTGLAPSASAAQAAAQALRQQRQPSGGPAWREVVLASVERAADGQRFELQAQLALPGLRRPAPMPGTAESPAPRGAESDR